MLGGKRYKRAYIFDGGAAALENSCLQTTDTADMISNTMGSSECKNTSPLSARLSCHSCRGKTKVFSTGSAADALAASMAVPLLFKPVWADGRPLLDGAVGDVAGVDGLERSERVLYHHVSCAASQPSPPRGGGGVDGFRQTGVVVRKITMLVHAL